MNTPLNAKHDSQENMPFGIDQEVDLLEYLHAILRYKYRVLLVAMIGAVAIFFYAKLLDDIFMATAVVAVNLKENPGGVSPKNYRASDALGLIEHDFLIDEAQSNERDRLMARMRSMKFSQIFIEENNLLSYIFHKQWNPETKKWNKGFKPDMREAVMALNSGIRGLKSDDQTGLLRINFRTRSGKYSAELANAFVKRFNQFIRDSQAAELSARRDYLEGRLQEVDNIELHRSIYRLMETQLAAESLLFARTEYPLEVIQPAFEPLYKTYPMRKKWAALMFIGLILMGVMVSIGSVLLKHLKSSLRAYQDKQQLLIPKKTAQQSGSYEGDDWLD